MDVIGLTQCDDDRKSREHDINDMWQKLTKTEGFTETYGLLGSSINLLLEALSCYQNAAYMGTVLMCRSATEAATYDAITRVVTKYYKEWKTVGKWKIVPLPNDRWDCLAYIAMDKNLMDAKLKHIIESEIRRYGNFAAHYGSKKDKIKLREIKDEKGNKYIVSEDTWVPRERALKVLKKTIFVIRHLIKNVYKKSRVMT